MYIDTRDLKEQRDDLKQEILDNWNEYQEENLDNEFEQDDFDDAISVIENLRDNGSLDFLINWQAELLEIAEIDRVEDEVCNGEFDFGTTLISEYDFQEYCEEFVRDCGYLSRDTPALIECNIDWSGIADDMRIDYSELEYQGTTYLFR